MQENLNIGSEIKMINVFLSVNHCSVHVQRKVRIGTILELYLRIVRIPTLSDDSGIVPDNSRIAQGVFHRYLRNVGMGWTK